MLGELDFSVVARVFLSLFVLLLTYNAVAGEKESGTLKAVLANPGPRAQLLLGKMLGLFGTLLAATAIPAILGLLIMKVGFRIELSAGDWARICAVALACGLYLLAILAVGVLVSTLTARSAVAFLVLLPGVGGVRRGDPQVEPDDREPAPAGAQLRQPSVGPRPAPG